MTIRDLQKRLTMLGQPIAVDGIYGGQTKAAILAVLTDPPDRALTVADVEAVAHDLDVEPAAIWAVRDVEASASAFIDGRPTILFEPHRFSRATGGRFDASHPTISYPKWGALPYPKTQGARWEQLLSAVGLDVDAGFASASYGAFQILGENYRACGAPDPFGFALAEAQGEDVQLKHFASFIYRSALDSALRRRDWAAFALGYNGPAYRANRYDEKLAAAYAKRGGK